MYYILFSLTCLTRARKQNSNVVLHYFWRFSKFKIFDISISSLRTTYYVLFWQWLFSPVTTKLSIVEQGGSPMHLTFNCFHHNVLHYSIISYNILQYSYIFSTILPTWPLIAGDAYLPHNDSADQRCSCVNSNNILHFSVISHNFSISKNILLYSPIFWQYSTIFFSVPQYFNILNCSEHILPYSTQCRFQKMGRGGGRWIGI